MSLADDVKHGLGLVEATEGKTAKEALVREVAQDLMKENLEFKALMQAFEPVRRKTKKMGAVMLQELIVRLGMLFVEEGYAG